MGSKGINPPTLNLDTFTQEEISHDHEIDVLWTLMPQLIPTRIRTFYQPFFSYSLLSTGLSQAAFVPFRKTHIQDDSVARGPKLLSMKIMLLLLKGDQF